MMDEYINEMIEYNPEIKLHFINSVDVEEITKFSYVRVLKKVSKIEKEFDKDVFNFTNKEYDNLLFALNAFSSDTIYAYNFCIKRYFEFCQINNYTNKMPLYIYSLTKEDLEKYINKLISNKMYVRSREEFEILLEDVYNIMDVCMFLLFFYGLKGEEMLEVRHLKKEDIDFENSGINVFRNYKMHFIEMPDEVMKIIKKTISAKEYISIRNDGNIWFRKLYDSEYLIRTIRNSKMTTKPMLTSRISNIKNKVWNNKYLTAGRIHRSGCALYAIDIMEKEDLSQIEAINKALIKYGLSKSLHYKVKDVVEAIKNDSQ